MLDHISIQCADIAKSAAFYDTVLEPLGGVRVMDFGSAIGYGNPPIGPCLADSAHDLAHLNPVR